jgi:hypothetical protein
MPRKSKDDMAFSVPVSVRVTPDQAERLADQADRNAIDRSTVIRRLLDQLPRRRRRKRP